MIFILKYNYIILRIINETLASVIDSSLSNKL